MASSTKLQAGSQLLTESSWDPGRLTSARRVAGRGQLPRRDTQHTWDGAPTAHPGNRVAGTDTPLLGSVRSPNTCRLSCLDLGRSQNAGPIECAPLWSTWEPELEQLRPEKCMQPRAHFRQFPCRATCSLSSVDWESTLHEQGQTQCGWDTASTPHTCQWDLQCSSLPTARLNKWA